MNLFEQLEELGYRKAGNWYIHNNCSINLHTKEIKSTRKNIVFNYTFEKNIDVSQVEKIRIFLDSFNLNP
jgi:hypothetical protein